MSNGGYQIIDLNSINITDNPITVKDIFSVINNSNNKPLNVYGLKIYGESISGYVTSYTNKDDVITLNNLIFVNNKYYVISITNNDEITANEIVISGGSASDVVFVDLNGITIAGGTCTPTPVDILGLINSNKLVVLKNFYIQASQLVEYKIAAITEFRYSELREAYVTDVADGTIAIDSNGICIY